MRTKTKRWLTAAVMGLAVSSLATVSMASGWEDKGDHAGHGEKAAKESKKDWGGAKDAMGAMSDGHMTARMRSVWNLDLSAEQRKKIRSIQRDLRAEHWKLEDKVEDMSDELFELYRQHPRDAAKIGKVYGKMFDLRRQMIELSIIAGNNVGNVLTKEQSMMWRKMMPKPKWGTGWGG